MSGDAGRSTQDAVCCPMRYRALGHSDLRVSEIALGSWLTLGTHMERDA